MGAGSLPLHIIEPDTYERRSATLDDMIRFSWLVDGLEHIAIGNSVVLPHDVPSSVLHAIWNLNSAVNLSKPSCCWYATSRQMAEDGAAVLCAAAGGADNLRTMKSWAITICPESPLTWGPSLYGLLELARLQVPIEVLPMPVCGGNAPVTVAGSLVQGNVEALSAIVLAQLVSPGCPVIYAPSYAGSMDMKLGAFCFGSPEAALQGAAFAQLGHWYGFPTNVMAGVSDSKVPDEQAGYEKMLVLLLPALAGADCITQAAGLLDFALSTSYEQMVIDDEICSQVLHLVKGMGFDEDALAESVIREVGPGGSYTGHEHTFRFFREALWRPQLSDRQTYEKWSDQGRKDIGLRARAQAQEIIAQHRPVGVPQAQAEAAAEAARAICRREGVESEYVDRIMGAKTSQM
jgi:trimethylamine---corrinoid protein Co-methyltransferase